MKKLISVLMILCLLCTAVAALAEETPTWESMPGSVIPEDGAEPLKDADFEGDWVVDKVFYDKTYVPFEQLADFGISIAPMRIADGKVSITFTDENGTREENMNYTLENNQIIAKDETGNEAVIEKLEDGNLVMNTFVSGEDGTTINISFFMVHPEK